MWPLWLPFLCGLEHLKSIQTVIMCGIFLLLCQHYTDQGAERIHGRRVRAYLVVFLRQRKVSRVANNHHPEGMLDMGCFRMSVSRKVLYNRDCSGGYGKDVVLTVFAIARLMSG